MKIKYFSILQSIIFIQLISGYYQKPNQKNMDISMCGFTDTLRDLKDAISGFTRFVQQLTNIIETISDIVGIHVLVLLFIVSILAAGLSAVGIPRGKTSFFMSLVFADYIWVLWSTSFNPGSYAFVYNMVRTNLILLSPYILILLIKRYWPDIKKQYKKLRDKVSSRTPGIIQVRDFLQWKTQYQSLHASLLESLDNDLAEKKDDTITISKETVKIIDSLNSCTQHLNKKP